MFGKKINTSTQAMVEYSARRADEFERVYQKPERRADLAQLHAFLSTAFVGQSVLEVACGTGYWTEAISKAASEILAIDVNPDVLGIARQKPCGSCRVEFVESDAYSLDNVPPGQTAGFHGFWWSHIPLDRIESFLTTFHTKLVPGAKVVMIDNRYVEGSSTPISRWDEQGNTYQIRILRGGSQHEVLKNFPPPAELQQILSSWGDDMNIHELDYYWMAEYRTR